MFGNQDSGKGDRRGYDHKSLLEWLFEPLITADSTHKDRTILTIKFHWLGKVISNKVWKHAEPLIIFQKGDMWDGLLACSLLCLFRSSTLEADIG